MAKCVAKFEVGNEVRIIEGAYPQGYYNPKIALRNEYVGRVGRIRSVDTDYPEDYLPDYRVVFEDGDCEQFDEVRLQLVAEPVVKLPEPQQYVVDSALALHAFEILERIEAKLTELDQRLAAHEEAARRPYVLNLTATILP